MDGTILGQGRFLATNPVAPVTVVIPSGADWMRVMNYTQFGNAGVINAHVGVEFYWQLGMAAGTGIVKYFNNAATTLNGDTLVSGGFTLYDPSGQNNNALPLLSAPIATTASTNANRPVVSTANTTGLIAGVSIVRMSNTAQTDVNGIDMVVGAVNAGVSFTLLTASNPLATAPGAIGGAGFYRNVNYDPLFYPRTRTVVLIQQGAPGVAEVSTSVFHGFTPGQAVRFNIPAEAGMIELNPTPANNYLIATVVSVVDAFNFTINVDTTNFTTFSWPTIAQQASSFPEVTPVGEDTGYALQFPLPPQVPTDRFGLPIYNANSGILADSMVNTGFLGMILGTGGDGLTIGAAISGPAGTVAADVMYWVAGKSTYGGQ